jgi:hypothetical protein
LGGVECPQVVKEEPLPTLPAEHEQALADERRVVPEPGRWSLGGNLSPRVVLEPPQVSERFSSCSSSKQKCR